MNGGVVVVERDWRLAEQIEGVLVVYAMSGDRAGTRK